LPHATFIKPKKAVKNASDAPKAAPAALKTPAAHAAAASIKKVKKAVFPLFHRAFIKEKHRGKPRCFSFFGIML
jgi:hypothetical protein